MTSAMTIPLQQGITYGPLPSRRLGLSLGVNLLPGDDKICNFNCPYCQYGWTRAEIRASAASRADWHGLPWPAPAAVADAVERALAAHPKVERITLAGNGEPTLHPRFAEVVERLRDVRARLAPRAKLAILSNASTVTDPVVAAALVRIDECCLKLDGGDAETVRLMNGVAMDVDAVVDALALLGGVTLQSMFVRDPKQRVDNTTDEAINAWLAAVRRVQPLGVQIYSLDRPAALPRLQKVPRATLTAIARRVELMGIAATVF